MSTQTQRHEERKKQRQSAEERRHARQASIILEKNDEEKTLDDLKDKIKKTTEAVLAGNLKEVIDKSKQPFSTEFTKIERRGRDKATLRLIEQIRKATEDEENLKTNVKQEPITEEEVVTTFCGGPGFNL